MKARAISKFTWGSRRYEVNDPVEVDEPKASMMVKEGLIELVAPPVESAAPEPIAPVAAAPVEPGNSTVAPAATTSDQTKAVKPAAKKKSKKK